jgi:hypothetical protein
MANDPVARGTGKAAPTWDEPANTLLRDWRQRAAAASEAHYTLASRLRRNTLWLGIPAVLLSSIVGTSLFATLTEPSTEIPKWLRIGVGITSLFAAVFAALQTFLRFGERAERHVTAADWYAAVRRDVDQLLALSPEERGKAKDCFDRIRKEMSKVGQQSPEISERLWDLVAAKYGLNNIAPPHADS